MTALGQSLPKSVVGDMSGLPSIATEERTSRDVSKVPSADVQVGGVGDRSGAKAGGALFRRQFSSRAMPACSITYRLESPMSDNSSTPPTKVVP
jgi:hypothetical protein